MFLVLAACHRPVETCHGASLTSEMVAIDSLMQTRPDSALVQLQASPKEDPYYQLLLSEALYKNDSAQLNRPELLEAMAHYDSLGCPFLSARCHYMNGVGYYEMDSVVEACQEYFKALEIMEGHYQEKDLVGYKAKFMALTLLRLIDVFSNLYLHEQTIYWGQLALHYYQKYESPSRHVAWLLDEIGSHYDMMEKLDSASFYYSNSMKILTDTNNITYRIAAGHTAFLTYKSNPANYDSCILRLHKLLELAESDREYFSGLLSIGEIYYHEKLYDSAAHYLSMVFENSDRVGLKKQAAEWLLEIFGMNNQLAECHEYANYLAPFANSEENNSALRSKLTNLCFNYEQNIILDDQQNNKLIRKRNGFILLGTIFILTTGFIIYYFVNKKKAKVAYYTLRIKQSALSGRLKQSNKLLRNTSKQLNEVLNEANTMSNQTNNTVDFTSYLESPICLQILDTVEKQRFKSKVDCSVYKAHALNRKQILELRKAADKYLAHFTVKIKRKYPSLREDDVVFCCLYLLGLKNADISALLQKAYPTVCERDRKIRKIIGSEDNLIAALKTIG